MQTAYTVEIETGAKLPSYAAENSDFSRTTAWLEEAKTWKTEQGARKWMERFDNFNGRVVKVRLGIKNGKPVGVLGA